MKKIDIEFIKTEVYYDDTSPSGLRWLYTKTTPNPKNPAILKEQPSHIKDNQAGCLTNGNYWLVEIMGSAYAAHRLVYSLVYGDIPVGMQIDHINGITTDNNISNLRAVTGHVNQRNRKRVKKSDAIIGGILFKGNDIPTGVRWDSRLERWVAQYYNLDGKLVMKCFYPKHYSKSNSPIHEALSDAICYRTANIEKLNELGAGYTETHGIRDTITENAA